MAYKSNTKNRLAIFEELPTNDTNLKRKNDENEADQSIESSSYGGDLVIDYEDEEDIICTPKKKAKKKKFEGEIVNLKCMWNDCIECYGDYEKYMKHIYSHLFSDDVKCLWNECNFEATNIDILIKHLSYHGYFTRLQNVGQIVVDRLQFPNCNQAVVNQMPEQYNDFKCDWEDCDIICCTYHEFLLHIALHIHQGNYNHDIVKCSWKSCSTKCNGTKLVKHMRSHTKEKRVACPTCWATFSSNTKLGDHRKRQMSSQLLRFQCCTCSKLFGSERLLREHMKAHINNCKCSMCEMTCSRPSSLLKHIRYRHLNDRPFKCHLCKKTSVTSHDLQKHLMTHSEEELFACEECDYKCRTMPALDTHYRNVHKHDTRNVYECHCCQTRFRKGTDLTKHLMGKHDYLWPPGHTRFRYKEDSNGIRQLQTVRYESLEVTQEMMSRKLPEFPENMKVHLEYEGKEADIHKYKLTFIESNEDDDNVSTSSEGTINKEETKKDELDSFEVVVADEKKIVRETNKQIEIVVEDVDEDGNIVRSETITSNEIMCVQEEKV